MRLAIVLPSAWRWYESEVIEQAQRHDWPPTSQSLIADPPHHTEIAAGDVHVWWSSPAPARAVVADFELLDTAERERADRFRMERDRARYVAQHAFVRRVLAPYLGLAPEAAAIEAAANGKPAVDAAFEIEFNASRSGGLSVVAVGRRGAGIGVDVEQVRPIDDALQLAHGHFSSAERQYLGTVPDSVRDEAFLALWTRKEAVVKAFGLGLSVPLDSFEVTTASSPHSMLTGRLGSEPFVVRSMDAPSGWVAAVSVTAAQVTVRRMDTSLTP